MGPSTPSSAPRNWRWRGPLLGPAQCCVFTHIISHNWKSPKRQVHPKSPVRKLRPRGVNQLVQVTKVAQEGLKTQVARCHPTSLVPLQASLLRLAKVSGGGFASRRNTVATRVSDLDCLRANLGSALPGCASSAKALPLSGPWFLHLGYGEERDQLLGGWEEAT